MLRQAQHVDNYFHEFRQEFSQDELFIGVEIVRLILAFRLYNSIRIRLKARISGGLKNPYSCLLSAEAESQTDSKEKNTNAKIGINPKLKYDV